ncbi:hypothetical protein FKG94_03850 [Exilibacterium tricleocarpae]|uniref:DUF3568 family protein n=1 Tax=Exilibacterium tricleocarpae TaxID=2591008 RepID=A0A545U5C1_9GAMM|nr:hypothetical protein [Exilibacterium tricleocarpae]TQV84666.1 hypothetical protein FKG94_03850 [Exilibacterium tricleocarpae]
MQHSTHLLFLTSTRFWVRLSLPLGLALLLSLSGCVTSGHERVSFFRAVSTHDGYTLRELQGEVEMAIEEIGYAPGSGGKWKSRGGGNYIVLERENALQPTIDIAVYAESPTTGLREVLTEEVSLALTTKLGRRMKRGEVKILKGFNNTFSSI